MKYIVNADDFGRTETVNRAIIESFEKGYISSSTIMVNMPYFDEAVSLARRHKITKQIGLHINLTSGKPLTEEICKLSTFVSEYGNFNSCLFSSYRIKFFLKPKEKRAVFNEVEAQIQKFLDAGFTLLHADSHGHVHTFPAIQKVVNKVLKKYGFSSVRISRNLGIKKLPLKIFKCFVNLRFSPFSNNTDFFGSMFDVWKQADFLNQRDGVTEIMLHPNYLNSRLDFGEPFNSDDIPEYITKNMISFYDII